QRLDGRVHLGAGRFGRRFEGVGNLPQKVGERTRRFALGCVDLRLGARSLGLLAHGSLAQVVPPLFDRLAARERRSVTRVSALARPSIKVRRLANRFRASRSSFNMGTFRATAPGEKSSMLVKVMSTLTLSLPVSLSGTGDAKRGFIEFSTA